MLVLMNVHNITVYSTDSCIYHHPHCSGTAQPVFYDAKLSQEKPNA